MRTTLFDLFLGDSLWDGFLSTNSYGGRYYYDGDDLVIEQPVPGFSEEDLSVELDDATLFVKGELEGRKISQALSLPKWVIKRSEDYEASVKNGLLRVIFKGAAVQKLEKAKKVKLLGT